MVQEIEATLVVSHSDPLRVMEDVAALSALGPYRLTHGGSRTLSDVYYDTPSRLLAVRGIAVRIREAGGQPVFCIKQDEMVDETGTAFREEIEMPWSRQCMNHIAHILHKLACGMHEVPARTGSPGECLACLGLLPVQERETTRLVLDASLPDAPVEGTLAALALDRVCYVLSGARILHHEIEIETGSPDLMPRLREITTLLMEHCGDALRPWRHNKLVTGFALERLIAEGALHVRPGRYTRLTPADYDSVEAAVKGSF